MAFPRRRSAASRGSGCSRRCTSTRSSSSGASEHRARGLSLRLV